MASELSPLAGGQAGAGSGLLVDQGLGVVARLEVVTEGAFGEAETVSPDFTYHQP